MKEHKVNFQLHQESDGSYNSYLVMNHGMGKEPTDDEVKAKWADFFSELMKIFNNR